MADYPIKAVKVTHDVVETLVDRGPVGVTEVANALDLPKSTAHDHLRTLERVGYAVNEGGAYRPSTKFLHIGKQARDDHELFVHGRERALELTASTDGTKYVQLVTEENGRCAVLFATRRQHSDGSLQASHAHPTHVHLHTNAPGKAILATLSSERVERILDEHGLEARTPRTITDETTLFDALERIRDAGYATDVGELIPGMSGVAAPIVTDNVNGAVAVYSASEHLDADDPDPALIERVTRTATEIRGNLIFAQRE